MQPEQNSTDTNNYTHYVVSTQQNSSHESHFKVEVIESNFTCEWL